MYWIGIFVCLLSGRHAILPEKVQNKRVVTFKEFLHIVACYDYCKCSFLRLSLKAATPLCRPPKDATNVPPRCAPSWRVESQIQWKWVSIFMSTLKNCGDIGWDLFRYLQLSVELCWHHKWATELADILRFMYLLTWLKIHLMVNSTPSLSRILELSLKSSDSSSVNQDHAVRADLRWFAVRLNRPDHPLQEDMGRC